MNSPIVFPDDSRKDARLVDDAEELRKLSVSVHAGGLTANALISGLSRRRYAEVAKADLLCFLHVIIPTVFASAAKQMANGVLEIMSSGDATQSPPQTRF